MFDLKAVFTSLVATTLLCLAIPAAGSEGAATETVGTLHYSVHGESGTPLILIPGLGSGAWVWADTIARFGAEHRIYALTLAGFDGTPAPARTDHLFEQAEASLRQLIEQEKIDRPVLVGHSLGGTLAIAFGSRHPELVRGIVAVDGLPIFPGMEQLPAEQRMAAAQRMGAMYDGVTAEQFAAQQLAYMQHVGVIDADAAARYGALQARSDPAIVAGFAREDVELDLRPELPRLAVPLLEIAPWNQPDFAAAAASGAMPELSEEQVRAYYASFLAGAPDAEVVTVSPARHFLMLDQPEKFRAALAAFLRENAGSR